MIECPKCKSKNISIVPIIKSEKPNCHGIKGFQTLLITFGAWVLFATVVIWCTGDVSNLGEALKSQFNVAYLINLGSEIAGELMSLYICLSILKWTIFAIIILGFIRMFLPYSTYSIQTYFCHDCEFQWKKTKNEQEDEE